MMMDWRYSQEAPCTATGAGRWGLGVSRMRPDGLSVILRGREKAGSHWGQREMWRL